MNPATTLPETDVRPVLPRKANPARFLYPAFAALLVVLTLLGFQQFYLHGRGFPAHPLAPPIKGLIIAHGIAMTGWILLFGVQSLLVASGHRALHMTLGWLGVLFAVSMLVLGVALPIAAARHEPDIVLWGLHRKAFMTVPLFSIALFTAFFCVAFAKRKRAQVHRPMMLLATLAIMAAATDRIAGLSELYGNTVWGSVFGPFFPPLVIGALFLVVKAALTRTFDRYFAYGFVAQALVSIAILRVAPTATWDRIATWLVS